MIINKFPDGDSALDWYQLPLPGRPTRVTSGSGPGVLSRNPVLLFGLGLLYGKY